MMPIGTANVTANRMVVVARAKVGSIRWPMSVATGRLEKIETPRSPCSRSHDHLAKRTRKGSLRPSFSRIWAMSSAVARSPAIKAAGSPGAR